MSEQLNSINLLQDDIIYDARRLVFLEDGLCTICDKKSANISVFNIEYLFGWIYCDKCRHIVKESVIAYINENKIIPVTWINSNINSNSTVNINSSINSSVNSNSSTNSSINANIDIPAIIKFYRKSTNKIEIGTISYNMDNSYITLKNSDQRMYLYLTFDDYKQPGKITKQAGRLVSLTNIFYHNNNLYHRFISNKNLFNHSIDIAYNDLSSEIKEAIRLCYEESKCSNGIFDL